MLHRGERDWIEGTAVGQAQVDSIRFYTRQFIILLIGGNVVLIEDGLCQLSNFSTLCMLHLNY